MLVTENQCLSQEINACHKKSILVRKILFLWVSLLNQFASLRESYKKICLSLYTLWEPGSEVSHEYAALHQPLQLLHTSI